MRLVALVVGCLLASACGGGEELPPPLEAPASARADSEEWIHWRDDRGGFAVTYPTTWQRAASPLTPHLSDPVELLALGTYELRPGGERCSHQPVNAIEDLGGDDGLIVIFERAPPFAESGYPPRRETPELTPGTGRFCVPGTSRVDTWLSFGESGRAFYALLALGGNASAETRAQLLAVYESLAFDRR